MTLADYVRQHLEPHGHDEPIVWSDLLAEQVADVALDWLTNDDDGRATAKKLAQA